MKAYYGTKLILAEPQQKDGKEGYAVKYNDGYTSWSPKDVFEEAYQPMNALSFGHAIRVLQDGKKVARSGWNGKGMWLILINEDQWSASVGPSNVSGAHRLPWIGMKTVDGGLVPWLASQTDVLANDWQLAE